MNLLNIPGRDVVLLLKCANNYRYTIMSRLNEPISMHGPEQSTNLTFMLGWLDDLVANLRSAIELAEKTEPNEFDT